LGIDFISHQEALDTSTPMREAMFAIIAAMAQLDRSIIRERVQGGIAHARLRGTKSGRPIGRPPVVFDRDASCGTSGTGDELGGNCKEAGHDPDVRRACLENQEQRYGLG
jgi:hypothetical protein